MALAAVKAGIRPGRPARASVARVVAPGRVAADHRPHGAAAGRGAALVRKLDPSPAGAAELRTLFDRIFKRRTRCARLDSLLERRLANRDELLRVLDRPENRLNADGSENGLRAIVARRKASWRNLRRTGTHPRDVRLDLARTAPGSRPRPSPTSARDPASRDRTSRPPHAASPPRRDHRPPWVRLACRG